MKFDIKTAVITGGALLTLGMLQGSSVENPNKNFTNVNRVKLFQNKYTISREPNKGYADYTEMNDFIKKHPQGFLTESASRYGVNYTYTYHE